MLISSIEKKHQLCALIESGIKGLLIIFRFKNNVCLDSLYLSPKVVSKQVLQTLCSLGCVEKMSLMGQDFYLVLKDKLIPIFPKPAGYYFERHKQEPPPNFFASRTQTKPITIRTLVGLWLLLVQMGHVTTYISH